MGSQPEKPHKAEESRRGHHLTAEWIEYEIQVPGDKPEKIRREIFDLIGPATRAAGRQNVTAPQITDAERIERGLALLGQTEILSLVSHLSPQFIEHLAVRNLLANRNPLSHLVRNVRMTDPKVQTDQASRLKLVPGHLYTLALIRHKWSRFRNDTYLDRLNVFNYHRGFRRNRQDGLLAYQGFDIVANDVAVRQGSGADHFFTRLEQGVLDSNAEGLLVKASYSNIRDLLSYETLDNTAEIFVASKEHSIKWLTIGDTPNHAWKEVALSKDTRARIEQDLADGHVVLVPDKAVPLGGRSSIGWWRVEKATGRTLGMSERGWGQGTIERHVKLFVALGMVTVGSLTYYGCLGVDPVTNPFLKGVSPDKTVACLLCGEIAAGGVLLWLGGLVNFTASFLALPYTILVAAICLDASQVP
jgi:hypothetical protein